MNISRAEVVQTDAVMNQLRNAIYHIARLIKRNQKLDVSERLRNMGKNISRTFVNYWKPIDLVNQSNVKDFLTTLYQKVVNSSISIEVDDNNKLIKIKDAKCALCKYRYDDVNIAGCEILLGLVSEFIFLINKDTKDSSAIFLEPYKIEASRALGNDFCVQIFKFKIGKK
jgi:preprotein translocase subunit SecA